MDKPPFLYKFVAGVPAPKGSKSFKGMVKGKNGRMFARLVESSKKVAPWDAMVVSGLLDDANRARAHFEGAVRVTLEFVMPRTGTHRKRGPTKHHIVKPDLDKLIRCVKDSITTAGVWRDDSQACEYGHVAKRYAEPGEPTGCLIMVEHIAAKEIEHGEEQAEVGRRKRADGPVGGGRKPAAGRRGKRGAKPPAGADGDFNPFI